MITVRLSDPLHARPANLLVRLASQFAADIVVHKGPSRANAKNILEVLSLGASKGDEIVISAAGEGADVALGAIRQLVEENFDADLVPEAGTPAVEGIAIGRAVLLGGSLAARRPSVVRGDQLPWTVEDEEARLRDAIDRVRSDLDELVRGLPPEEAELFVPEQEILRALTPLLCARVRSGQAAEDAVIAETGSASTDLFLDARMLLLDALGGQAGASLAAALKAYPDDLVLVTDALPPSLVASLPTRVVGLVVALDREMGRAVGPTSHAAILARGRGLPLAFVPSHVVSSVAAGDLLLVDTTLSPARIWINPGERIVTQAHARRRERLARLAEEQARVRAPLALGVAIRVNIGSMNERVPQGAEGIGLLRTELVFAGRGGPPSEGESYAVLMALAKKVNGGPIVVRLFDAGGDKPLTWLPPPASDPGARGIGLLLHHPSVLDTQLRAIARARAEADVRVLIPLVRSADDVSAVRARLAACAPPSAPGAPPVPVGAMIETVEAAGVADPIAAAADFISIGTNDLTASLLGVEREETKVALPPRLLEVIRRVVQVAHARGRTVTVCGEVAGHEKAACLLAGVGVDALSMAPGRVAPVKLALASLTSDDCRRAAFEALHPLHSQHRYEET